MTATLDTRPAMPDGGQEPSEPTYPVFLAVKITDTTERLFDALNAAALDDGVDRSNRIRALIHIWLMDDDDPNAPKWLPELREQATRLGREYAFNNNTARGGRRGPRP